MDRMLAHSEMRGMWGQAVKRILLRALVSSMVALTGWSIGIGLIIEWLVNVPPPAVDDLGAGMVAAAIGLGTLPLALIALVLFNIVMWSRDRRVQVGPPPALEPTRRTIRG